MASAGVRRRAVVMLQATTVMALLVASVGLVGMAHGAPVSTWVVETRSSSLPRGKAGGAQLAAELPPMSQPLPLGAARHHVVVEGVQALVSAGVGDEEKAADCVGWDSSVSAGWCEEGKIIPSGGTCTTQCLSSSYAPNVNQLTCVNGTFQPAGFACAVVGCRVPAVVGIKSNICKEKGYGAGGVPAGGKCTIDCEEGLKASPAAALECIAGVLEPSAYRCVDASVDDAGEGQSNASDAGNATNATGAMEFAGLDVYECPAGFYEDKTDFTGCAACPLYSTTHVLRATHRSECICIRSLGYAGRLTETDGFCQPIRCKSDHRVKDHACVPCAKGFINDPGDDCTLDDTECEPELCGPNYYVKDRECVKCPEGSSNLEGDDATQGDSECDPLYCGLNEYVHEHQCRSCPAGHWQINGTDAMHEVKTKCNTCPIGKFRLNSMDECESCPPDSSTVAPGAVSGAQCVCNPGFAGLIDREGNGVCNITTCVCDHGVPANKTECPIPGEPICRSCDIGYRLEEDGHGAIICRENGCECRNGIGAMGALCEIDGGENCVSCNVGYRRKLNADASAFECERVTCPNGYAGKPEVCECDFGFSGGGPWDPVHLVYPACTQQKAVPCVGKWSLCSAECTRQYSVVEPGNPAYGAKCPFDDGYEEQCFDGLCANPPEENPCLASWSVCDSACKSTYELTGGAATAGGAGCFHDVGSERDCLNGDGLCTTDEAEMPCKGHWTTCDTSCTQQYVIDEYAAGGGAECPFDNNSTRGCKGVNCHREEQACEGEWLPCDDELCTSTYVVLQPEHGGGAECPHSNGETRACRECASPPDEVACQGSWGVCDDSCTQTYVVSKMPKGGGAPCPFVNGETRACGVGDNSDCQEPDEPVDCEGGWSSCRADCKMSFAVTRQKRGLGRECPFENGAERWCSVGHGACHERSHSVNAVGVWSECNADCRSFFVLNVTASGGGLYSLIKNGEERYCTDIGDGNCLSPTSPVDCVGSFSECNAQCKKTFTITTAARFGGKACNNYHLEEGICSNGEGQCDTDPTPCVGEFGLCMTNCKRTYTISENALLGGEECPHAQGFQEDCTGGLCPVSATSTSSSSSSNNNEPDATDNSTDTNSDNTDDNTDNTSDNTDANGDNTDDNTDVSNQNSNNVDSGATALSGIFVDCDGGDDSNSGLSTDAPVRTLHNARDLLQKLIEDTESTAERTVHITGKCYPMTKRTTYVDFSVGDMAILKLKSHRHSGSVEKPVSLVQWKGKEPARLIGGLPLRHSAWKTVAELPTPKGDLVNEAVKDNVLVINLMDYDLNNDKEHMWYGSKSPKDLLGKFKTATFPECAARQAGLFFKNKAMELAMYPDNDKSKFSSAYENWNEVGEKESTSEFWFSPFEHQVIDPNAPVCYSPAVFDSCIATEGVTSKFKNGCHAYAYGWPAGQEKGQGNVNNIPSADTAACNAAACDDFCEKAYNGLNDQKSCMEGCKAYAYILAGTPTDTVSDTERSQRLLKLEDRVSKWSKEPNAFLHGYFGNEWADEYIQISATEKHVPVDAPMLHTLKVQMTESPNYGIDTGGSKRKPRFRAVNLLSELTAPGEYYLDIEDDTGGAYVYFYPPSSVGPDDEAHLGVLSEVITTEVRDSHPSLEHVNFEGLTIEYGRNTGLALKAANAKVIDCTVQHFTKSGAKIEGSNIEFRGNVVHETGCYGLFVTGGDEDTITPSGISVLSNDIGYSGRITRTYQPGIRWGGVGHVFKGNKLHDSPHACMYGGGNDVLLEDNHFEWCVQEASDMGAFYTGQSWVRRGGILRKNTFENNYNLVDPFLRASHVASVYLDDMQAGYLVTENTFRNAHYAFLSNGGRDNIFSKNVVINATKVIGFNNAGQAWGFINDRCNMEKGTDDNPVQYVKQLYDKDYLNPPYNKYPGIEKTLADGHDSCAPEGNRFVDNRYCHCYKFGSWDSDSDLVTWAPANPTVLENNVEDNTLHADCTDSEKQADDGDDMSDESGHGDANVAMAVAA